jgi:pathogenesis-related protein 1
MALLKHLFDWMKDHSCGTQKYLFTEMKVYGHVLSVLYFISVFYGVSYALPPFNKTITDLRNSSRLSESTPTGDFLRLLPSPSPTTQPDFVILMPARTEALPVKESPRIVPNAASAQRFSTPPRQSRIPSARVVVPAAVDKPPAAKDSKTQRLLNGQVQRSRNSVTQAETQPNPPRPPPAPLVLARSSSFENILLSMHNNYRQMHNVAALTWDVTMAARAQSHAQTCQWGHQDKGTKIPIGQNIYASTKGDTAAQDAMKAWYDEIRLYNFDNGVFSMATGHFTALVWKATSKLGCGVATCTNGLGGIGSGSWTYVVCDYSTPGNVVGQFKQNVLRPK